MKRLVKLTLFAAVVGGLIFAARKLMGGLGPQPGDPQAPKEWPSLVPDPPAQASGNGSAAAPPSNPDAETPGSGEQIAPTGDSGTNS